MQHIWCKASRMCQGVRVTRTNTHSEESAPWLDSSSHPISPRNTALMGLLQTGGLATTTGAEGFCCPRGPADDVAGRTPTRNDAVTASGRTLPALASFRMGAMRCTIPNHEETLALDQVWRGGCCDD